MTKTYRYTVLHSTGAIAKYRVPDAWRPFEVAAKWQHGLVFLHVPPKQAISALDVTGLGYVQIHGPAVVFVASDEIYQVPQIDISTEDGADRAYRESAANNIAA